MRLLTKHNTWLVNVFIYNFLRLNPFRNNRIWVFGAWMREKYDDNARFMFEYVNKYHANEIETVWVTQREEVVQQIRALGYKAYLCNSWMGKWYELRAGVALYTHGVDDFGLIPLVGGARIISLWHGIGLKKIYNEKYSGLKLRIKEAMDFFFSWTYRDETIITSEFVKQLFQKTFSLRKDARYCMTGLPRNDGLFNVDRNKVLEKLGIDNSKKVILYMPTYRMEALGKDAVKNIIKNLCDDTEFDDFLRRHNYVFIAKPHPVTPKLNIQRRDNFVVLENVEVEYNQALLGSADMLITDYSTCCIDYALLNRPILFYVPDEKDFMEKSEAIYDVYFEISRDNRCTNQQELMERIENPFKSTIETINNIFNDESTRSFGSCKRVYEFIINNVM